MTITITNRPHDGQVRFKLPEHNQTATVKVNGVPATVTSQDAFNVTIGTPTVSSDTVEITYTPVQVGGGLAAFSSDRSGLLGTNGNKIPFREANSFAIIGDSRAAKYFALANTVGAGVNNTVTNGILSVVGSGYVPLVGERINIMAINTIGGIAAPQVNNSYTVKDVPDPNSFTVDLGDPTLNGAVLGGVAGNNFQITLRRYLAAEGWIASGIQQSEGRIKVLDNFAIGGSTIGGSLPSSALNQVKKALATGARNILMDSGINDINGRTDSEDTIFAGIKAIYAECAAAGAILWDASTVHIGTGYSNYANADTGYTNFGHHTNAIAVALNDRRAGFALENPGYIYVPIAQALVDPTSATGATLTSMLADGIHDNATGARAAGAVLASMLKARFPAVDRLPYSVIASVTNQGAVSRYVTNNPLFNTGAESSGLANSWTSSGSNASATFSTVQRTTANDKDAIGKNQIVAITATGAGSFTLRTSGSSAYSVTDVLKAVADIKLTGMSNVSYLNVYVNVPMKDPLGTDRTYVYQVGIIGAAFDNTDITSFQPNIPDIIFPAGYSDPASKNLSFFIVVGFSAAGAANLSVGRAGVIKLLPI